MRICQSMIIIHIYLSIYQLTVCVNILLSYIYVDCVVIFLLSFFMYERESRLIALRMQMHFVQIVKERKAFNVL